MLDLSTQPGRGVRALRLLDMAEAHNLRNERAGVIHMIGCAARESVATVRFLLPRGRCWSTWPSGGGAVQQDAREFVAAVGIAQALPRCAGVRSCTVPTGAGGVTARWTMRGLGRL